MLGSAPLLVRGLETINGDYPEFPPTDYVRRAEVEALVLAARAILTTRLTATPQTRATLERATSALEQVLR